MNITSHKVERIVITPKEGERSVWYEIEVYEHGKDKPNEITLFCKDGTFVPLEILPKE